MDEVERIRRFLRAVRGRALLAAGLRAGALTVAGLLVVLLALALCAARMGPAAFWPTVTGMVLFLFTAIGLALAVVLPRRRLRGERAVAVLVGRRHPPLASDLLSAVELAVPEGTPTPHGGSPTIAQAFFATVSGKLGPLDARRLVPLRGAARCGMALAVAVLGVGAAVLWAPAVRRGLDHLSRHPSRFEGALVAREPLMGDVRLTYAYPAYTGLPARVVDGSTGEIVALKGSRVSIEARLLQSAREARLLLGDTGEKGEAEATIAGGRLQASLTLSESGSYRVWLMPRLGRPLRENRAHRIIVEADRPPDVEIRGPADRLDLPAPRPIEVGYTARDDFGLGTIDLVYRLNDGPEQRMSLADAAGARSASDRTVFEPPTAGLGPGARIAYRIEARDRDAISGAKAGSSRTLYVVIQNPRDDLDERVGRQREILDKLLASLADRLELSEIEPLAATAPGTANALVHLASWLSVHEGQEGHLALLGRVVDEERRAGMASKALIGALAGIANRLGEQMRLEAGQLQALRGKADQGKLVPPSFGRLRAIGIRHVRELEGAVLTLDDLISRQRLEDLASLGRDLTTSFKKLQDLLARYNNSRDEALRRQLAREIQELRARIQELARRIAEVKARNEVPTEWQNMPDMKDLLEKTQKLDELLAKGDAQSLSRALAELGQTLESLQQMLESNADDCEGERFSQENRAAKELMKKLGDIEGDQRALAQDGSGLAGSVDEEMARKLEGQRQQLLGEIEKKAEALRQALRTTPPREVGDLTEDELARARHGSGRLERLLPAHEWGEARKETQRIARSVQRLQSALEGRAARRKLSPQSESFAGEMAEASRLSQELVADLERLVPRPEEAMTPEQRERSRGLGDRQGSVEQRTQELAGEMNRRSGLVPGAAQGAEEVKAIGERMGEAANDFGQSAPRDGASKAQDAADRLAKLREGMGQRQMGRGQKHREPVRIPGADESKAPREWRQELLEAMRERPPDRFREEVRKYYEELVK